MRNIIATVLSGLILMILTGYTVFWNVLAHQIKQQADALQEHLAPYNILVDGAFGKVSGFPSPPQIEFTGSFSNGDYRLHAPRLRLQGFPLPGQTLRLTLPAGFKLDGPDVDSVLWSAEEALLQVTIPLKLPYAYTVEGLRQWRAQNGSLTLQALEINKDSLLVSGNGTISLDENLQPSGQFTARISGYTAFMGFLEDRKIIDSKQSLVARMIFNGLARQDDSSGERYVETAITLQSNKLLLGPLVLFSLPQLSWPYDAPLPAEANNPY